MTYMGVDIVTTVSCFKTWWECGSVVVDSGN